jgi:hypothetical protein
VNALMLLLVLLVVAYIGGHWASSSGRRAFGSASGIEYVALGMVLGPEGLGALDAQVLAVFQPVSLLALGWIALGYGVEVGEVGDQGVRKGPVLCGLLLTGLLTGATAGAVALLSGLLALPIYGSDLALLSVGIGLVSAQSVRDAVIWVVDRDRAGGPLTGWLMDFSRADDAPVLLALPFLFAFFHPPQRLAGHDFGPAFMASLSLLCGAVLGLMVAWLLAHASSRAERWTLLLGAGLLATGGIESIGLSAMGTCFALGVTLSLKVKNTEQMREKLAATEGPVLLPALLLAGAHLAAPRVVGEWWMLALATTVRVAVTVITGSVMGAATRRSRAVVPFFALGLLSSGTLSMIVGFALLLRFDGHAGRATLATAFIGTVLGELVGAPALRRALMLSGELAPLAAPEDGSGGQTRAEATA